MSKMIHGLFIDRSRTTREHTFYKSCKGFVFFGVPNRGLKNQALIEMSHGQSNSRVISDLLLSDDGIPSQYLTNLHNSFKQACRELRETFETAGKSELPDVCVFYETEKSPTKELVSVVQLSCLQKLTAILGSSHLEVATERTKDDDGRRKFRTPRQHRAQGVANHRDSF